MLLLRRVGLVETSAMQRLSLFSLVVAAECFQLPSAPKLQQSLSKLAAPAAALAVTVHSEAAHAKSVLGVNGALDFGPLAGDQPGGEGTGKALGINDDSLGFVLAFVALSVFFAFAQWQSYQDDDDDFFDTYDSRRGDRELSNRNRV